jgi:signal transduction histidine kinase
LWTTLNYGYFFSALSKGRGFLLVGTTFEMYAEWLAEPESGVGQMVIIQGIKKLLEESTRTVKDISFKLSPHILQNYCIEEALNAYAEKAEKSSNIHIAIPAENVVRSGEIIETIIYRVICECINNSLKHAKASNLVVSFKMADNILNIDFSDDGIGIGTKISINVPLQA